MQVTVGLQSHQNWRDVSSNRESRSAVSAVMMVVRTTLRPTFTAGAPRLLFQGKYGVSSMIRGYDVTADGRRFLMVQQKERPAATAASMGTFYSCRFPVRSDSVHRCMRTAESVASSCAVREGRTSSGMDNAKRLGELLKQGF